MFSILFHLKLHSSLCRMGVQCCVLWVSFLLSKVKGFESVSNPAVLWKATGWFSACCHSHVSPKWRLKGTATVRQKWGLESKLLCWKRSFVCVAADCFFQEVC